MIKHTVDLRFSNQDTVMVYYEFSNILHMPLEQEDGIFDYSRGAGTSSPSH